MFVWGTCLQARMHTLPRTGGSTKHIVPACFLTFFPFFVAPPVWASVSHAGPRSRLAFERSSDSTFVCAHYRQTLLCFSRSSRPAREWSSNATFVFRPRLMTVLRFGPESRTVRERSSNRVSKSRCIGFLVLQVATLTIGPEIFMPSANARARAAGRQKVFGGCFI